MHGLFVVTTLVIFNSKSALSAIPPVHRTTENKYVTTVSIYCAWSLCHHNGDN